MATESDKNVDTSVVVDRIVPGPSVAWSEDSLRVAPEPKQPKSPLFRAKKTRVRLFCGPKFRERGFWISPPVGGYPAIKVYVYVCVCVCVEEEPSLRVHVYYTHTHTHTAARQAGRQTDRQAGRQTDRQADR